MRSRYRAPDTGFSQKSNPNPCFQGMTIYVYERQIKERKDMLFGRKYSTVQSCFNSCAWIFTLISGLMDN